MPIVEIRAPGGPQSLVFWLQISPSLALRLLQGLCQCELTSRTAEGLAGKRQDGHSRDGLVHTTRVPRPREAWCGGFQPR